MNWYVVLTVLAAAAALVVAAALYASNKKIKVENARVEEISGYIRTGAMAFLRREYKVIGIFAAVLFAVLLVVPGMGWKVAVSFLSGALLSVLAGFIGMKSATNANARTAQAAMKGERAALNVAFSGGAIMGLCVVGLGLLGVVLCYVVFGDAGILTGFSLGASSVALFARVGGGIYTKAADVGADLVGKVEAGIPEDDPRNPAVIADNVGDNVGDVAGMGADLFESYVGSIVSAIILGLALFQKTGVLFVVALCGLGVVASVLGILCVKAFKKGNVQRVMMGGTYISMGILLVGAFALDHFMFGGFNKALAILTGIVAGVVIGMVTEWYTSGAFKHVKEIVKQSKTGPATNILAGLSIGMRSTAIPIIVLVGATIVSALCAGLFGIALSAVGMLATVGAIIAVDAYGPIADNAGGIAQMANLPAEVREITDRLDAVGNTTAAIGKGFSIGSAALTALALLSSYATSVGIQTVDLLNATVIGGVFLGAMLAFLFSSMAISAVSKSAGDMILEVRRQFREITGLLEGTGTPDYARCVDIATASALRQMIVPGLLAVLSPVAVGLLMGKEALAGMLIGATVSGVLLAIFMSNSGGAWDNAKKSVEEEGKGTDAHAAAVIGDTVGDPLKDTAGPSLNILIKLMSIVALLFAPLFM
ncbi:sodium-translocating pyrophosphatase [Christensenellaceae bacterium OttesenSCG-928-L17]|nr:sodium-translocating pyrophosphatase [Christensenellaceae bacterium OttesenSCG-928-L17]